MFEDIFAQFAGMEFGWLLPAVMAIVGGFLSGMLIKSSVKYGLILVGVLLALFAVGYFVGSVGDMMTEFLGALDVLVGFINNIALVEYSLIYGILYITGFVVGVLKG